jgi:Two component regulator propeller
MFLNSRKILITLLAICPLLAAAQDKPIGYWRSLLPYNSAIGLATDGSNVFTVCTQAFFTYQPSSGNIEPYSKVEGMADIGMKCVGYDIGSGNTVLVYTNGNIDIFKNNTFYNVPDLKVKTISGNKTIYSVFCLNGYAYISTSIGIIVLNLTTHNIDETYQFIGNNESIPVLAMTECQGSYFAVTSAGLYRADTTIQDLQNFQEWQIIDTLHSFNNAVSVNNQLFLSNSTAVYAYVADTFRKIFAPTYNLQHIDAGNGALLVSQFSPVFYKGYVTRISPSFAILDSALCGEPMQSVQLADNSLWIADGYYGLEKKTGATSTELHIPPGPSDPNAYDIYAYNKMVWVAHGGFGDLFKANGNFDGVSYFNNAQNNWTWYKAYVYAPFDTLTDFTVLARDRTKNITYMGSYLDGLFTLYPDGGYTLYKQNSIMDPSSQYSNNGQRQVIGLAFDKENDLWVSTVYASDQLYVIRSSDTTWYKFTVPNGGIGGPIVVDDNDQIWMASLDGGGLTIYNTNGTLTDPSDDYYYHMTSGVGSGNLPSNNVYCIAKDNDNNIWIGTDNGIGIASNCVAPFTATPPCDANIPIVQYDQFAGYLFANYNVKTIAVDGANRKWVGTDQGVWLLSPDAQSIVYNFNVNNSPLPSNSIQKISVDPITGDVYIGTEMGLVSFRSTATEGGTSNQNVTIFPNPVKSGYDGTIAIKGLVTNADVRITDINGQLVYKTTANGGQATWNGKDYTGHRPQSGVYLVFVSNSDGSETYTGKIVFIQ